MNAIGTLWWVIIVVGVATFGLRASFILRGKPKKSNPEFSRLLRYVPTAALAALVTSAVLSPPDGGAGVPPRALALALAALIAWRTRNVLVTLVGGMGALWLFQWLLTT